MSTGGCAKSFMNNPISPENHCFNEVYFYYCHAPDETLLDKWEAEYWETVKAHTSLFPEAEQVLAALNKNYQVALITNTQGQKTAGGHRISLVS